MNIETAGGTDTLVRPSHRPDCNYDGRKDRYYRVLARVSTPTGLTDPAARAAPGRHRPGQTGRGPSFTGL